MASQNAVLNRNNSLLSREGNEAVKEKVERERECTSGTKIVTVGFQVMGWVHEELCEIEAKGIFEEIALLCASVSRSSSWAHLYVAN